MRLRAPTSDNHSDIKDNLVSLFNPDFQFDAAAVHDAVYCLMTSSTGDCYVEALNTLGAQCYGASAKSGWWHDLSTGKQLDRDKGVMIALIHSEISEGLEGVRKGLKDDHLTDRLMVEVELADTLIRIADFFGGFGYAVAEAYPIVRQDSLADRTDGVNRGVSVGARLAILHTTVAFAHCGVLKASETGAKVADIKLAAEAIAMSLAGTISELVSLCQDEGYDLAGAVADKMSYNQNRADHKVANRAAAGGKAF